MTTTENKVQQKMIVEEKKILAEERNLINSLRNNLLLTSGLITVIILLLIAFCIYLVSANSRISIDDSLISAPIVDLAPTRSGVLEEVYVHEGDVLLANTVVARVGTELIKTRSAAQVIKVTNNIGKNINPGESVVTIIDPSQLRVVGKLQEDKGLKDVHIGQQALFTVDAYGSQQFEGIVDEVSPTAHQGDVVFNISDERAEQDFDVKIRFDVSKYSQLRNGMSAKIVVFKN